MSKTTPLVISYIRFSRPEQERGDSLRRQTEASERWAAERGLRLAKPIEDLGVSAYKVKHAATGNLADFLALIEAKRVPVGSVLIVEQIDRLSRQQITKALRLFMQIIEAGIKVVTLNDGREYTEASINANPHELFISIIGMATANQESEKKSVRLKVAWEEKRRIAGDKVLTRRLPAWLELKDGKIVVNKEKAAIIRELFTLTSKGYGIVRVQQKLNAKYRGIVRAEFMSRTYVHKVLTEKAVLGQFQLHKMEDVEGRETRVPVGEPLVGYFPRIVSDELYYAAQQARKGRIKQRGRSSKYVNLFTGLLFNADDKSPMIMQSKRHRIYASRSAINGVPGRAEFHCLPVVSVELATIITLTKYTEFTDPTPKESIVTSLEERLTDIDAKVATVTNQMLDGQSSPSVVALLNQLDAQKATLVKQVEEERGKEATTSVGVVRETVARLSVLIDSLTSGSISIDERMELRQHVARLVERITLKVRKHSVGGKLFEVYAVMTLRDGRTVPYAFQSKFRKSNTPAKRGYLTWLRISDDQVLELGTDIDGVTYMALQPSA